MTKTWKDWKINDSVRERNGDLEGIIVALGLDCDGELEQVCFRSKGPLGFYAKVWAKPTDLMLVIETP